MYKAPGTSAASGGKVPSGGFRIQVELDPTQGLHVAPFGLRPNFGLWDDNRLVYYPERSYIGVFR